MAVSPSTLTPTEDKLPVETPATPPRRRGWPLGFGWTVALLGAIALALRLYGINWESGFLFHPDERAILMKVSQLALPWPPDLAKLASVDSPLNPKWFPYGSMPLYLVKFFGHLASLIDPKWAHLDYLRYVGRGLSSFADIGTIVLIALIGRRFYRPSVGLLAAAFATFAVLAIQQSHFFVVDVVLVFFMTLTVYASARVMAGGGARWTVLSGIAFGLAVASKVSVAPFGLVVILAQVLRTVPGDANDAVDLRRLDPFRLGPAILTGVIALGIGAVTFAVVAPYSFIDWATFSSNITEQSEMVRRIRDYPYTRQYIGTPLFWYEIQQLTVWGLGIPLGIAGWLALFITTVYAIPTRRKGDLLILTAVWPYFILTGLFQVKFLRYLLPLVPFLSLLAARWLLSWRRAVAAGAEPARSGIAKFWRALPAATIGVVLGATIFYALAFVNLYSQTHPAVAMSHWIKANVPAGSILLKEHWEEGLPDLPGYKIEELLLYEPDTPQKVEQIVQRLSGANYLEFYSNRLYGTIPRLPDRYPMTSEYYRALFDGSLGFQLTHAETSYPNLLGVAFVDDTFGRPGLPAPEPLRDERPAPISINLGYADESFTVYDHPKVLFFSKTPDFNPAAVRAKLQSALSLGQAANAANQAGPAGVTGKTGLVMTPEVAAAQQAGGTWSELFDPAGFANRLPAIAWLGFVELVALLGLPLTVLLLHRLPDRGYLLGKSLSLLLVVYLVWLGASLRVVPFSRGTIWIAAALIGWISLVAAWPARRRLIEIARTSWRTWLIGEGIFLIAFVGFYLIRLANPDLWHAARGGEKPMDFAYLNAVVKSTFFPPYDPWFAGGYLNYYYFGQVIVATVIKATGVVPAVAYNLAVPLLFAYFAANVYSIGYNLIAGRRPGRRIRPGWIAGGVAAAVMVAVFGNLDGWAQIVDGLARVSTVPFDSAIPALTGLVKSVDGFGRVVTGGATMPPFDFWRSSRMMPPTPNITEFPYFTFLFADLHAHLIGLPFTALAIGLGLGFVRALQPDSSQKLPWRTRIGDRLTGLGLLVALGLTVGSLRAINSWDYPTYLLVGGWAILVAELARRRRFAWTAIAWTAIGGIVLLALTYILFRPYITTYELFYSGVLPSAEKTPFHQYLGTFGLFLFAALSFLAVEFRRQLGDTGFVRTARFLLRHWSRPDPAIARFRARVRNGDAWINAVLTTVAAVGLVLAAIAVVLSPLVAALTALLGLIGVLVVAEVARRRAGWPVRLFVHGLLGAAAGLGLGVDLVTIQGDIGRMNTVFKFYLQAWVLWGIAAAFALAVLVPPVVRRLSGPLPPRAALLTAPVFGGAIARSGARPHPAIGAFPSVSKGRDQSRPYRRPWEAAWLAALTILVIAGAIYPLGATPVRLADRFRSLPLTNDGMAFMAYADFRDENRPIDIPADEPAIRWMLANVPGSPVIAEGVTPLYRWGSRVSVYTGLPTIIGWDWHQKQQRWGYQPMVEERLNDVRTLFTTPDPNAALAILRKYGVRYVYVGPVEKVYYPAVGLAKFQQMAAGRGLKVVYDDRGVTIYEVAPPA